MKNNLSACSAQMFKDFIKDKDLKTIQGEIFHSTYWVDNEGNKVAYMETSSYHMNVYYAIANDKPNFETLNLIGDIINGK